MTEEKDWRDILLEGIFNLTYDMLTNEEEECKGAGRIVSETYFKIVLEITPRGKDPVTIIKEQDLITKVWYYACEEPERLF